MREWLETIKSPEDVDTNFFDTCGFYISVADWTPFSMIRDGKELVPADGQAMMMERGVWRKKFDRPHSQIDSAINETHIVYTKVIWGDSILGSHVAAFVVPLSHFTLHQADSVHKEIKDSVRTWKDWNRLDWHPMTPDPKPHGEYYKGDWGWIRPYAYEDTLISLIRGKKPGDVFFYHYEPYQLFYILIKVEDERKFPRRVMLITKGSLLSERR